MTIHFRGDAPLSVVHVDRIYGATVVGEVGVRDDGVIIRFQVGSLLCSFPLLSFSETEVPGTSCTSRNIRI